MGQKKIEMNQRVEVDKELGRETIEKGEDKIREAEASKLPLTGEIEIIDDDDEKAVELAIIESNAICGLGGPAISEIKEPNYGDTDDDSINDSTSLSFEAFSINVSSELQQSGQEFLEILEENDQQESDELQKEIDQIVASLEGVF